jgi:hypothetical protein
MKRSDKMLILILTVFFAVIFGIQRLFTGTFYWSIVGVAVLSPLIIYLASKRWIQRLIGEYPHPKRSNVNVGLSWGLAAVLMLVFSLFLLDQLNKPQVDYKNFTVFVISPILFTVAVGMMKVPNITKKAKTGLVCVIKKLGSSVAAFVIFFPFFTLTNKLQVNINSAPDFHEEFLFNGFVGWAMAFCFYIGLFLFIFALSDFILAVQDLKTRKPSKPRQARQHE